MKQMLVLLLCVLLCAATASAQSLDLTTLVPQALPAQAEGTDAALYSGPTQGFYRHHELTLPLYEPLVFFGQYDCWAMVASGTPEDMGPVGWIECASAALPSEPQLSFDNALSAMVEEDTFLTDDPMGDAPAHLLELPRGTQLTLLAQFGAWFYIQQEGNAAPIRGFVPAASVL